MRTINQDDLHSIENDKLLCLKNIYLFHCKSIFLLSFDLLIIVKVIFDPKIKYHPYL